MRDELAISLANLAESLARKEAECVYRRGHLYEIARALSRGLRKNGDAPDVRTFLGAAGDALREQVAPSLDAADRAALALLLLHEAGEPSPLSLSGGPVSPSPRSRVVYVRNPLSDLAYERLSSALSAPTVGYRQNFRELFDDVENGYADYAVLPLLSGGVPIPSVTALLEERSLFVAAVCSLPSDEEVLFALLAREAVALRPPTYFLFRFLQHGEGDLAAMLTALAAFDISLLRMEMHPVPYGTGESAVRMLVSIAEGRAAALLTYLALFVPDWIGYGYFSEIS